MGSIANKLTSVDFIKLVKYNLHTQDDPQNAVSMFMHSLSISLNPAVVFELLHYFNITNPKNYTFRSHPSDFSFLFPLLSHLRKDSFKQFILFVSCFFFISLLLSKSEVEFRSLRALVDVFFDETCKDIFGSVDQ